MDMRSDSDIEKDILEELTYNPEVDAGDIAVSVKGGVVTLAGYTKSYVSKYAAEDAAKRVQSVKGIANDIEVRLEGVDERPDPDIARDCVAAITAQLPYSHERVKCVVKDGW